VANSKQLKFELEFNIKEVNQQLESIKDNLQSLAGVFEGVGDTFVGTFKSIENSIKKVDSYFDSFGGSMEEAKGVIDSFVKSIKKGSDSFESVEKQGGSAATSLSKEFRDLMYVTSRSMASMEDAIKKGVGVSEAEFASLETAFRNLSTIMNQKKVEGIVSEREIKQLDELRSKINKLQTLSADIEIKTNLDEIVKDAKKLEQLQLNQGMFDDVSEEIKRLEARVKALTGDYANLDDLVDSVGRSTKLSARSIAAMRSATAKLSQSMRNLNSSASASSVALLKMRNTMNSIGGAFSKASNGMIKSLYKLQFSLGQVTNGMQSLLLAVGGLYAIKSTLDLASELESLKLTIKTLSPTMEDFQANMEFLTNFAQTTPMSMADVTQAFIQFSAYGLTPTEKNMRAVVDAVSTFGGNKDQLTGIIRALGQIQAKGKLMAQEARQLQEQGIDVNKIFKKELAEVGGAFGDMQLTADEANKRILQYMEDTFGGVSIAKMQTFQGKVSNLGDSWQLFVDKMLNAGKAMNSLKGVVDDLTNYLNGLLSSDEELKTWSDTIGDIVDGIVDGFKAFIVDAKVAFDYLSKFLNLDGSNLRDTVKSATEWILRIITGVGILIPLLGSLSIAFGVLAAPFKVISGGADIFFKLGKNIKDTDTKLGSFVAGMKSLSSGTFRANSILGKAVQMAFNFGKSLLSVSGALRGLAIGGLIKFFIDFWKQLDKGGRFTDQLKVSFDALLPSLIAVGEFVQNVFIVGLKFLNVMLAGITVSARIAAESFVLLAKLSKAAFDLDWDAAKKAYSDYKDTVVQIAKEGNQQISDIINDRVREEVDATKGADKEFVDSWQLKHQVAVDYNNKVLQDHKNKLNQMIAAEKGMVVDTSKLWTQLRDTFSEIAEERFESMNGLAESIDDIYRNSLGSVDKYNETLVQYEQAKDDAIEALRNKDYEKYKAYKERAKSLISSVANTEVSEEGRVVKSKQQTAEVAINGLQEIAALDEQYYDRKKQDEKDIAREQLKNQKALLEAKKEEILLEIEQIKNRAKLIEQTTGKPVELDFTQAYKSIESLDKKVAATVEEITSVREFDVRNDKAIDAVNEYRDVYNEHVQSAKNFRAYQKKAVAEEEAEIKRLTAIKEEASRRAIEAKEREMAAWGAFLGSLREGFTEAKTIDDLNAAIDDMRSIQRVMGGDWDIQSFLDLSSLREDAQDIIDALEDEYDFKLDVSLGNNETLEEFKDRASELYDAQRDHNNRVAELRQEREDKISDIHEEALSERAKAEEEYASTVERVQSDLASKIEKIEEGKQDFSNDIKDRIESLSSGLLEGGDKYADTMSRAESKFAEALREQNEGNFERANELLKQSASLAEELAGQSVTLADGTVVSAEDSTAKSIELMRRAADAQASLSDRQIAKEEELAKQKIAKATAAFNNTMNNINKEEAALLRLAKTIDDIPSIKEIEVVINYTEKNKPAAISTSAEAVPGYNTGGFVRRMGKLAGYGGGDKVRALLEKGEFVVRKEAVKAYGSRFISALNNMQLDIPRFQTGGLVGDSGNSPIDVTQSTAGTVSKFILQGPSGKEVSGNVEGGIGDLFGILEEAGMRAI
jgi:tape measure domain-containing protein